MKEAYDMTHKELAKNLLLDKIHISYHANGKKKYEYRKEKEAEQEARPEAIKAINQAFKAQFNRAGQQEDYLFNTLESYKGKPKTRINKAVLWDRLHKIGIEVKEQGIIKRDIQFSAHLFRRTFATLLYKSGMKLKALQKATRHASVETLAKHYIDDTEPTTPYFDDILQVV